MVIGTHYLKVGACVSLRLRFSLVRPPSYYRSTLGSQACLFDLFSANVVGWLCFHPFYSCTFYHARRAASPWTSEDTVFRIPAHAFQSAFYSIGLIRTLSSNFSVSTMGFNPLSLGSLCCPARIGDITVLAVYIPQAKASGFDGGVLRSYQFHCIISIQRTIQL